MVCRDHWTPDSDAPECVGCGIGFTLFRRRHHCRCCGRVFCAPCSQERRPLPQLGYEEEVRVCTACATTEDANREYGDADPTWANACVSSFEAYGVGSGSIAEESLEPEDAGVAIMSSAQSIVLDDGESSESIQSTTPSPSAPITFHRAQATSKRAMTRKMNTYTHAAYREDEEEDAAMRRPRAWKFSNNTKTLTAAVYPDAPASFSRMTSRSFTAGAMSESYRRYSAQKRSTSDPSQHAAPVPYASVAKVGHTKSVTFSIPA
eukprot:TRINITY_DN16553_c1_g1_i1.p1 TRINITY_DN16553_c1_g1~~TRINITY_DN16553_c1_g1_i1.p1  ORF type:complete len:263 (+),score=46.14 TRINITY_DN16553_c1_g1_i1:56-844(+)